MTADLGGVDTPDATGAAHGEDALSSLMGRVRVGDEDSFATLYDMTSARIHGLVLHILRAPDLAAEVTQEVYVEVWRKAGQWDPGHGSVRAWMTMIAHRRAVDRVRSTQRQVDRDQVWAIREGTREHDLTWERVERGLDEQQVRSALDGLTALQRQALQLAYYDGYSHREVAESLDLPLGTAKSRIRDALTGLRTALRREVT